MPFKIMYYEKSISYKYISIRKIMICIIKKYYKSN